MKNLSLSDLAINGLKVVESNPLWINHITIGDITIDHCHRVVKGDFGYQIEIEEEGSKGWITIKNGVAHTKPVYTVSTFTAERDYEKFNVVQGQKKIFAH